MIPFFPQKKKQQQKQKSKIYQTTETIIKHVPDKIRHNLHQSCYIVIIDNINHFLSPSLYQFKLLVYYIVIIYMILVLFFACKSPYFVCIHKYDCPISSFYFLIYYDLVEFILCDDLLSLKLCFFY